MQTRFPAVRSNPIRPLLRWAGSKRSILPKLLARLPSDFGRYYEPFAGSACFFFSLRPKAATLGDLNTELIQAYQAIRVRPSGVALAVAAMPRTKAFYYKLRDKNPRRLGDVSRAARFVYLNRYCFNGVFRTNRQGRFNVPRGTQTGAAPAASEFEIVARILRRTTLRTGDFVETLRDVRRADFVYLDPPYVNRKVKEYGQYGYESLGPDGFDRLLAEVRRLDDIGAYYLLSFTDSRKLRNELPKAVRRVVQVQRNVAGFASKRRLGREVLLSNF